MTRAFTAFPALWALPALPALLLAGCLFRDDDASLPAPIVPLATGNTWTYADSTFYSSDSVGIDSARVDVLGERVVTVNGSPQTVYLLNTRDRSGMPGALTLYVQNRRDGEYTLGAARDTAVFLFETLHVKHPGARGERYPTYFLDLVARDGGWEPLIDTVEIEVAVPDTTCVTQAGTFACTEYRGRRKGVQFARTWYAPGVGYLGSDTQRQVLVDGETRLVLARKRLVKHTLR